MVRNPPTYDKVTAIAINTSGTDPYRDQLYEIGSVQYCNGEQESSFFDSLAESIHPESVLRSFLDNVGEKSFCIAHGADTVETFLRRATSESVKLKMLDTRDLARICFPSLPSYELLELCDHLDIATSTEQSTLAACENTVRLWEALRSEVHEMPRALVAEIYKIFATNKDHPFRMLFKGAKQGAEQHFSDLFRRENLPRRRKLPDTGPEMLDVKGIEDIFAPEGALAARITGYECRPQQAEMAKAVAEAFNNRNHLMVEAGTGVGKSLAYLMPAALWSLMNNTPVVISTNTKNLQSQLFEKDMPLVRELLENECEAVIIKGRRNYVCLRKVAYLVGHAGFELSRKERISLASVLAWASTTISGDISECSACGIARDGIGEMVTSDRSECRGSDCNYRTRCFLFRARRKALAADVIIANHAVVFAEMDMDEGSSVLPPYRHIVLDEAHNLEDAATSWLAQEVSTSRLYYLLRRLWRTGKRKAGNGLIPAILQYIDRGECTGDRELVKQSARCARAITAQIRDITPIVDEFFGALETLLPKDNRKESVRIYADRKRESQWDTITAAKETLIATLSVVSRATEELVVTLKEMEGDGEAERLDFIQDLDGALAQIQEQAKTIEFVLSAEAEDFVFWAERVSRRQGNVRAWGAPVRIGPMLMEHLYSQKDSVILTSATLSVGGSLNFMKKRVGLDLLDPDRLVEMNTGTPFDYARQCSVMVPLFLPDPTDPSGDYIQQLGILLSEVFRRTRGRGMALFTSYDMLRRTSQVLRDELSGDCIQVLVQGESGSRENIMRVFKEDLESVLMGTHSFWEGVDVIGESLSCLAVTRLPFAVFTDPIFEARCEQVEADGQSSFMGFSLPNAIIRFRQGFGRLIRHRTDRGIVIVTDRRIVAKRYGQWFRKSIPATTRTFQEREEFLDAVENFMQTVDDDL